MDDFYGGKRVVISGGCGMIGHQLVKLLLVAGASVIVLDDMSRGHTKIDGVEYIGGSAANANTCRYAFLGATASRTKPVDAVFNLAAKVAGVLHNENHNLQMFNENVMLQTMPLEVAERVGVEHFLQTSSACVYAPELQIYAEEKFGYLGLPHPSNGGYAWSKRVGEHMAQLSNIPHVVIVRPINAMGVKDYYDELAHVIPAIIRRVYESEDKIVAYGSGDVVREFVNSKDVARGMMLAMAGGNHKEAYNLGTNGETASSIADLIDLIKTLTGNTHKEVVFDAGAGGGDKERRSSGEKANAHFGYKYEIGLRAGLAEVIEEWLMNKANL